MSNEERIAELLAANNALVERERAAKAEVRQLKSEIGAVIEMMLEHGDDIVAMRMLRRIMDA